MSDAFDALPPAADALRLIVAIPARDEERLLPRQLAALAAQRDEYGAPLPPGSFDTIVFANGCRDATAAAARAVARATGLALHVVEDDLPARVAHVGTARKAVMDAAARRFLRAGRPSGLVAATDADSIVAPTWVATTLREAADVDVVAGRIELPPGELATLPAAVRAAYLDDDAYWQALAECEAARDPLPWDPAPRHGQHFGASLCVRAGAYVRSGGVPPLTHLEDLGLYCALVRVDARVRHSRAVRVATSARSAGRVAGGLATFLGDLHAGTSRGVVPLAERPALTLARIDARAALRHYWAGTGSAHAVAAAGTRFGLDALAIEALVDRSLPFGTVHERYDRAIAAAVARVAPVPLVDALAALRAGALSPSRDAERFSAA